MVWPFSASSFRIFRVFLQVSLLLLFHDCSRIQIQKTPIPPDFHLSRQVSLLLQPPTRQGMRLSAFLENSTLRRVLNFFLALASGFAVVALSISGLFDAIGWFTDEELVETVDVKFTAVGIDFATILLSPFLFLHPCRHRPGVYAPNLNLGIQITPIQQPIRSKLCGSLKHVSSWDFGLILFWSRLHCPQRHTTQLPDEKIGRLRE